MHYILYPLLKTQPARSTRSCYQTTLELCSSKTSTGRTYAVSAASAQCWLLSSESAKPRPANETRVAQDQDAAGHRVKNAQRKSHQPRAERRPQRPHHCVRPETARGAQRLLHRGRQRQPVQGICAALEREVVLNIGQYWIQ